LSVPVIISYFTSLAVLVVGILLMTGNVLPDAEKSTRMVFGVILIIYGIYRVINTHGRQKLLKLQEKQEWMKNEKEKMMNR